MRKVPIEISLGPAIMAGIAPIFQNLQTFNKVLWKDSLPNFQQNLMKNTQNMFKISFTSLCKEGVFLAPNLQRKRSNSTELTCQLPY